MALNWDLSAIANHKTYCFQDVPGEGGVIERQLTVTTESMIWATMLVGIGVITHKNCDEFWYRLSMYEKVTGAMRRTKDGPVYFTYQDVRAHIGLRTNVSQIPTKQWVSKLWNIHTSNVEPPKTW